MISELQSIITGKYYSNDIAREAMSHDQSIFRCEPKGVVVPENQEDVVAVVRYLYKSAVDGNVVPLTMRGKGNHFAGGAIGSGVIMRMSDSLSQIISHNSDSLWVEAGVMYGDINRMLERKGMWIPPQPLLSETSTVGGLVSINASGSNARKYGTIRNYVNALKVVLFDGTEIETRRISGETCNAKQAQEGTEGNIYRGVVELLSKHHMRIEEMQRNAIKNSSGYSLREVVNDDGFDLGQLFIGAEGTLGVITAVELIPQQLPGYSGLIIAMVDSLERVALLAGAVKPFRPSSVDVIDASLLKLIKKTQFRGLHHRVPSTVSGTMVLIEFDSDDPGELESNMKAAQGVLEGFAQETRVEMNESVQEQYKALLSSGPLLYGELHQVAKPLPFVEDCAVGEENFVDFAHKVKEHLTSKNIDYAMWGHIGSGELHVRPILNLGEQKDRDMVFEIAEAFYQLAAAAGGTISGEHGDGIMRAPYLHKVFGHEMIDIFKELRRHFDPHGMFNPLVKTGATIEDLRRMMRKQYSIAALNTQDVSV